MTTLIRGIHHIPAEAKGGIVTLGNFDGVHLGHQKLINEVVSRATAAKLPSVVITFEPHPFEFFAKGKVDIPRITRFREKFLVLAKLKLDYILLLKFNQFFTETSAQDFIKYYLETALAPKSIMVGDDFRFGKNREGNFQLLKTAAERGDYDVSTMPTCKWQGERVSSTLIRKALVAGELALATSLLGRPYTMSGRVRHGNKLGRQLGFPTANIFLHRKLTAVSGVFSVIMHGLKEGPLPGVASVGIRPTLNGTRCLLEVHLFDFNQTIYGQYVEVEFCEKLRDEERYPDIETLKQQIAKDVTFARDYFKKQGVL